MRTIKTKWIKGLALIGVGIAIGVAMPGAQPSTAGEAKRVVAPRSGYVNIAKILRDFDRANAEGTKITKVRESHAAKVGTERDALAKVEKELENLPKGSAERNDLELKAAVIKGRIQLMEAEANKSITELSNKTIVEVYSQIRDVVTALAKDRGLDLVEAFPAVTSPFDENRPDAPQIAQLMLQTPALMPYYLNPELDFTEEVIERLNKKYPAEKAGK